MIDIMKTLKQPFFYNPKGKTDEENKVGFLNGFFITKEKAKSDGFGRPSKKRHYGRQPGSYHHKRDIVRASRRRNRGVKHK
jgi:hypothetical protein